jgi:hypothetical protein|nr:MAG TPA: ParB protein [Caudoviricetes sp.]
MKNKNKAKIVETSIGSLVPDDKNFNKGTEFGDQLMDESLRKFGLGRSILIDKNNRIIAGNKTAGKAGELGFENVVVVETDGNTLVAVKRNDIDLDSKEGRELALADNATSKANLSWDEDEIISAMQEIPDFIPESWGVKIDELVVDSDDFGEEFELPSGDKSPYQKMTFTLSDNQVETIQGAISLTLKDYPEECKCVDGNTNKIGNALAKIIQEWEELKK